MAQAANTSSSPSSAKAAKSPLRSALLGLIAVLVLGVAAWQIYQQLTPAEYSFAPTDDPRDSNAQDITAKQLLDLPLTNDHGQPVSLRDQLGKKHQVIVFTRGSLASVAYWNKGKTRPGLVNVCPYCSSQITGIARLIKDFEAQDTEVLIVFPITTMSEGADAATMWRETEREARLGPAPVFPILLDLELKAVDALGIRSHLARPSSFILDKEGHLRFAYVGREGNADRPSGTELLRQIREINGSQPSTAEPPTEIPAADAAADSAPPVPEQAAKLSDD